MHFYLLFMVHRFVINTVIVIISHYDKSVEDYTAGIAAAVLVGAVIGQLAFGVVADKVFNCPFHLQQTERNCS